MNAHSSQVAGVVLLAGFCAGAEPAPRFDEVSIRNAVTLYASFDEQIAADIAGGQKTVRTRSDDPQNKGKYIIKPGYPEQACSISRDGGIAGGALKAAGALPKTMMEALIDSPFARLPVRTQPSACAPSGRSRVANGRLQ